MDDANIHVRVGISRRREDGATCTAAPPRCSHGWDWHPQCTSNRVSAHAVPRIEVRLPSTVIAAGAVAGIALHLVLRDGDITGIEPSVPLYVILALGGIPLTS